MRELRTCPVTGVTVLLNDAWPDGPRPAVPPAMPCWACAAHGPWLAHRGAVRATPHPVPALGVEGDVVARTFGPGVRREGVGAHELVFAGHDRVDPDALAVVAARIADLRGDARLRGFAVHRVAAPGVHPTWELYALPTDVPPTDARAWRAAEAAGPRRVAQADGALAVAAFAPTAPWETWVVPAHGDDDFPHAHAPVAALAERVLVVMERWLGGPVVHVTVAFGSPWRLVLRPAVAPSLRTEAIGLPGHGVFPERAARELRDRM